MFFIPIEKKVLKFWLMILLFIVVNILSTHCWWNRVQLLRFKMINYKLLNPV